MGSKIDEILQSAQEKRVEDPLPSSKQSRENGVKRTRGLRVLVIDGGGSRGIVAATILKKLEEFVIEHCGGSDVHLADHFDLIAGTSAGGMIALAHGHHRLQLDDIVKFFASGEAFSSNLVNLLPGVKKIAPLAGLNKYSGAKLEKLLKQAYGADDRLDGGEEGRDLRKAERNDLFLNPDAKRPRVFALASPAGSMKAGILFTNYGRDEYVREAIDTTDKAPLICSSVPAWAAARATSAAPTYFPEAKIAIPEDNNRVHCFWDGALVNNSPVIEAVTQTEMLFGYDREFELILSIGCGEYTVEQRGGSRSLGLSDLSLEKNFKKNGSTLQDDIKNAIVNSEKEFQSAKRLLMSNPRTRARAFDRIYRLNPTFDKLKLTMDETKPKKLEEVQKQTESWCGFEDIEMQLKEIARIVTEPQKRVNHNDDNLGESRRARAMECAVQFFPPLVRLTDEEKNELHKQEKSDKRELYEESAEAWVEKYKTCIEPILEFLENVDSGFPSDVERCRFTLWRCYLNRLIIYVKTLRSDELKRDFLRDVGLENLLRIEESLLPLDKANALGVMKIDRERPFCPEGIAWISKSHLKILSKGLKLTFGVEKQRVSIDNNHFVLRDLFENSKDREAISLVTRLDELIRPVLPGWMKNHKDNEDFVTFYRRWEK